MPETLKCDCKCTNCKEESTIPFDIQLAKKPILINNEKYYAFNWFGNNNLGNPLGYFKYEDSSLFFLNTDYNDSNLCGDLIKKGVSYPYGSFGNVCSIHFFLSFNEEYYSNYIYHIGFLDSYFIRLSATPYTNTLKNETFFEYELTPTKFQERMFESWKGGESIMMNSMVVSDKRGFIQIELEGYHYGKKYECIFQDK